MWKRTFYIHSKRMRTNWSNNNDRIDNWRQIERNANKREKIIIYDNQWFLAVFNVQLMAYIKMDMVCDRWCCLLFMESYFCVRRVVFSRCCNNSKGNYCVARHRVVPLYIPYLFGGNLYPMLWFKYTDNFIGKRMPWILLNW